MIPSPPDPRPGRIGSVLLMTLLFSCALFGLSLVLYSDASVNPELLMSAQERTSMVNGRKRKL